MAEVRKRFSAIPVPSAHGRLIAADATEVRHWDGAPRRLCDVAAAAVGLLISAPILLVVALAIVLESPGGPLYWQTRVGRNGRTFRLIKLRTMVIGAEV